MTAVDLDVTNDEELRATEELMVTAVDSEVTTEEKLKVTEDVGLGKMQPLTRRS